MRKSAWFILSCFMIAASGCDLQPAPECVQGQEKCVDDGIGTGVYYVCIDGKWGAPVACQSTCDGNLCAEFGNMPS